MGFSFLGCSRIDLGITEQHPMTFAQTDHPHIIARGGHGSRVLVRPDGSPFVRPTSASLATYHLVCLCSLSCYLFVPCDADGTPEPPSPIR
jgi:hypothetical protein